MTCYEALKGPESQGDASTPMAHHFVKWWRAKFRNGYKKFSVGDSERTDTEELCGRASQCSAPPDLLPSGARALLQPAPRAHNPHPPHTPHTPHAHQDRPKLRFGELTCDVELQHEQPSRQKPLQFSFTLYDLDGHGRITKDDIAGIVSTIYESIGKSVTVPHYGSKTIQVRLTVKPETPKEERKEKLVSDRSQRREGRRRPRRRRDTQTVLPECGDATDDERRSVLSLEDDASFSSGDRKKYQGYTRLNRTVPPCQRTPQVVKTPPQQHPHSHPRERDVRPNKKRSSSLQRRELLEIIQANMEKNHLSFQTPRKPPEPRMPVEEDPHLKHQRLRNRAFTVNEKPILNTFHKRKIEPNNGYLDLAQTDRIAGAVPDPNLCRYDRYLHAVICSSTKHANSGYHQKNHQNAAPKAQKIPKTHPHRVRTHEVPQQVGGEPRVLQIIFL